jgi:glycerol-3-phosphate acyltransferase PlsY
VSPYLAYPLVVAAGYLIGSISFAVLISKYRGVDIFSVGSGNPGATNVLRVLGKPWGYGCFLLDALKGILAVAVGSFIAKESGIEFQGLGIAGILGAIVEHSYSIFLGFRGGKGVATTTGGLFALMPPVMLVGAAIWIAVFLVSRYVSLASMALGVSLPISAYLFNFDSLSLGLCLILALLILFRHRANIRRLIAGKENRAGGNKS